MSRVTVLTFLMVMLISNFSFAQQSTVSGTVTDVSSGETLPGVNILAKGTTTGTSTNAQGQYELSVESLQDTLVFSFVGYQTQNVAINGRTEINIAMQSQAITGEEMVVVGYGTQEKRNVTASVASVDEEEISETPVTSTTEALKGRVAGVNIQNTGGGQPGEEPQIIIRGRRSINASNDPLFVVDGIPFEGNISDISTQNIKSVDILKDAAATAIYGSRGANGVILITTKRGSSNGFNISYSGYYGVSEALRIPDMMNGQEYANLKRESRRSIINADGNNQFSWRGEILPDKELFSEVELTSLAQNRSSDWVNMVLSRGNQQNHHLSFSGGNEDTQFLISGNYLGEKSIIKTNGYKKYSLRVNLDHSFGDRFRIGTSVLASKSKQDWDANPMYEAFWNNPLGPAYDEQGNLIFLPTADGLRSNPLADLQPGVIENDRNYARVFASIYGELDLLKNLTYRLNFGPDYKNRKIGKFTGSMTNERRGGSPTASKESDETFSYTLENILTYTKTFNNDHNLDITLLQSIQNYHYEDGSLDVRGLPFESQKYNNVGTAQEILGVNSNLQEWKLSSFMGRFNYNYKEKYLFQISGRTDGSSRLAEGNKWAFFPGASVGWRIIEEPFMKHVNFLNRLKLRASYGVVGNTSISPYQTKGRLERTTYNYDANTPGYGYGLNEIANPELGWEKTATVDVGIDFGLISGRVSGSVDYYHSRTTDLLLRRQLPTTSGYSSILQNVGETKNTGIEISLSTVNINSEGGFRWTTDLNWSANNEKIVKLFNKKEDDIGNEWFIGKPINVFYDYDKIGIWQKNETEAAAKFGEVPGQIKVKDQNGDGKIDGSDRVILGSRVPDWIGGMTNRFYYKGFDLSVVVFARMGNMIESEFRRMTELGRFNTLNVDFWTPNNSTNDFPRPNQNYEHPLYGDAMSYFDASYLKIRNITLGYNLSKSILANIGLSKLRFYVNIKNAAVISDYKFADPEQADGNVGFDIPSTKLYSCGINLGF